MCDNKQALIKIEKLCDELKSDKIDFVEFINEFEIVCYNDISSRNLDYFADGWSKATVSSFMKVCLRAFVDEDEMSQSRLIVDLGIDDVDFEVNIMSENFVEFECISKVDSEIRIAGYIDITSVDDDEPDMYFYNQQGLECGSYVPSNPF